MLGTTFCNWKQESRRCESKKKRQMLEANTRSLPPHATPTKPGIWHFTSPSLETDVSMGLERLERENVMIMDKKIEQGIVETPVIQAHQQSFPSTKKFERKCS